MKWLAVLAILSFGNTAANDWFGVEFIGWGTLYDSTDNSFGSGLPAEIGGHTVTFVGSDETNKGLHFMLLGDYTSEGWPESLVWSDTKFGEWDRDRLSAITPLTGAFGPGGATVTYWSEYLVGDPPPTMYADATDYDAQLIYTDIEEFELRVIQDRERDTRSKRHSQNKGEGIRYKIDFSRLMTERGESVSSATWEAINGDVTISNTDLTTNIASADVVTNKAGMVQVKVTATQADGNKRIKWIDIQVIDPEYSTKDYL